MPSLRTRMPTEDLRTGLDKVRQDFEVPGPFPPGVEDAAQEAIRASGFGMDREDARDLPLLTIDPPGSRDLDQAFFLSRRDGGFRIHYAISDLAPFVPPGGTVDAEAWRRGQTIYMPDLRSPLHPTALSEEAASLLPNVDRPALLWSGGRSYRRIVSFEIA
jgi:exoribonuclease R